MSSALSSMSPVSTTVPPELSIPVARPERGAKAAREFEAQLIASVLESLEKTFGGIPGDESMAGADDYNYVGTRAFSQALAEKGGFGIAALILKHLPVRDDAV